MVSFKTVLWALAVTSVLVGSTLAVAIGGLSPGTAPTVGGGQGLGSGGGSVRTLMAPGFAGSDAEPILGPLNDSQNLDVLVGLTPPSESDWSALLAQEYGSGSMSNRHFMSAAAFQATLAPSPQAYAAAEGYFEQYGLTVVSSPDRLLIQVRGPAELMGEAFDTSFDRFGTNSHWFYSHALPASLPSGYSWSGALGLGNQTQITPADAELTPLNPLPSGAGTSAATSCPSAGGAFIPCQIQTAYNETPFLVNGTNGTGFRIGIVDRYDGSEPQTRLASDLARFESTYGIAGGTVQYLYPVPTSVDLNATPTGWGLEEALDLEWAKAMAPGASVDMTFAPDASAGLYAAVDWLVAHQAVNVLSLSWGEPNVGIFNESACGDACNATSDGTYALLHPVLMEAALEGITVFAASGDCGAADGTNGVSTNYPASDPWVTGVGATVLTLAAHDRYGSEVGWYGNTTGTERCVNQGGSGGGYSPFPRPWWQAGPGVPSTPEARGVPDVSADGGYPVAVVEGGQEVAVEGTSVATPVWAGFAAVADNVSGRALGFLNPSLYAVLRSATYAQAFHDVTQGYNGYYAGPGWDPVTGIGSPNLLALVPLLNSSVATPANFSVELLASPRSGEAPLVTAFNVSIQGGEGAFPLVDVSFGDGSAALAVDGRVNHTFTQPGVYAAQAVVFDSEGNSSVSPLTAIVVGGGSALNVTLTSSAARPAVGAAVTFNATTVGGVAPLRYDFAFGDGTYLNDSPRSSVDHTYGVAGGYCASVVVADSGVPASGGTSNRLGEAVGKAAEPSCTPWVQLRATLTSPYVAADLPGDFPLHISIVGGTGADEVQYVSDDTYATACHCTIFRTPGVHTVVAFVNDSLNQEVRTQLNFTLYPELNASFVPTALSGPAPFTLGLSVFASGGYEVNTSRTSWLFGDGTHSVGSSVQHQYTNPGLYRIDGSLSDGARGNASEAFLVDVYAPGNESQLRLTASLDPGARGLGGSTVVAEANVSGGTGPVQVYWSFGSFASGFGSEINESLPLNGCVATGACPLDVNLTATDGRGQSVSAMMQLAPAEAGRSSALNWTDQVGPTNGTAPLLFNGSVRAAGVPSWTVDWTFGDGGTASGSTVQHAYLTPGNYTEVEIASDPWGDRLVRTHAVTVGGRAIAPLTVSGGPSGTGGPVPWTVSFSVGVGGGGGGPYAFLWSFGDGNNSTAQDPTHTYTRAGDYNATLVVSNPLGVTARESYALFAYDQVPVDLSVRLPDPVLAGGPVPIELGASVKCPTYAPAGCNVSQVTVVVRIQSGSAATSTVGAFSPSGLLDVNLTAPDSWGSATVNVTVVGPNYAGSAQATVQVELITFLPALIIGGVIVAAAITVAVVLVRRRRATNP